MSMSPHLAPRLVPFHSQTSRFASGESTPRAFLEACIERIETLEPSIGAFVTMDLKAARLASDASSARWKDGKPLSAIDGMPVGVKDIIETADLPTQMGSPLYDSYQPRFDAASVSGLHELGAVVVGKTVTTEFASSQPRGTRNPWDTRRTPGGSSSGSAASVGAGMLPVGLGTQVVGSIVRPAGFCGVVGYKPSIGAINRGGSMDFLSQSCTGTLAASLEDAWLTARLIAGVVGGDPGHAPLDGPEAPPPPVRPQSVGLLHTSGWDLASDAAKADLERAIAELRAAGIRVETRKTLPELDALEQVLPEAEPVTRDINAWEWRWPLNVLAARDKAALSPSMQERAMAMNRLTAAHYKAQLQRREEIRALHAKLIGSVDALISLTAPGAAPIGLDSTGNPIFVVPGSLLGVPVVTLPLLRDAGLPVGLQIIGYRHRDAALFSLAAWLRGAVTASA
jgi:Asp-tRNA(Asn)/Glu-tRNA(Gln) amidotransferase A subunit family amidase